MNTKLLGHSIHPMLIVFPLGLLSSSLVFDLICLATGNALFGSTAYWMMTAGIVGAVVAAPFGTIDWLGIPSGTRAKRVGLLHGLAAAVTTALFICSWLLRGGTPGRPTAASIALSFTGLLCVFVAGWLGGELVERLGIGVDADAHSNAPSSLGERETRPPAARGRAFGGPKPSP